MDTPKPQPAPGAVQTTIDSSTTTVDPATTTIHNRVEPGGAPHADDVPAPKAGTAMSASVPFHSGEPKA